MEDNLYTRFALAAIQFDSDTATLVSDQCCLNDIKLAYAEFEKAIEPFDDLKNKKQFESAYVAWITALIEKDVTFSRKRSAFSVFLSM